MNAYTYTPILIVSVETNSAYISPMIVDEMTGNFLEVSQDLK